VALSERYELRFAERGETIVYSEGRRKVFADFTSGDGVRRFFPDSVTHWTLYSSALPPPGAPTEPLTPDERLGVLERILRWLGERRAYATHRGEPVLEGQVLYVPLDSLGDAAPDVAALIRRLREGARLRIRFEPEMWLELGDGREIVEPSPELLRRSVEQLDSMDEPFLVYGLRPMTFVQLSAGPDPGEGMIVERRDGPDTPVRQLHLHATGEQALQALAALTEPAATDSPPAEPAAAASTPRAPADRPLLGAAGPRIVGLVLVAIGLGSVWASHLVQVTVLRTVGVEVLAHVQDVSLNRIPMHKGFLRIERTATFGYEHPPGVAKQLEHEYSDGALDTWEALRTSETVRLLRPPLDLFEPMPVSDLHVHPMALAFGLGLIVVGVFLPRLVASARPS
jgi:hypothetical protein